MEFLGLVWYRNRPKGKWQEMETSIRHDFLKLGFNLIQHFSIGEAYCITREDSQAVPQSIGYMFFFGRDLFVCVLLKHRAHWYWLKCAHIWRDDVIRWTARCSGKGKKSSLLHNDMFIQTLCTETAPPSAYNLINVYWWWPHNNITVAHGTYWDSSKWAGMLITKIVAQGN